MASETDQILHSNNPDDQPPKIDPKWQGYYERLLSLRDQLIDSTKDLQDKAREVQPAALKNEPGEIGTETFQRDYALGMSSNEQELLTEVDAAIERIKAGTYGICEVTQQPISAERLEAVPWTRYSLEGQKKLEESGAAPRAGIGDLGSAGRRGEEDRQMP